MKEIERFNRLKELGYKYDPETGDLFGSKGDKIKRKSHGYIVCSVYDKNKSHKVYSHRFIWWLNHNEIPEEIDHINRIRDDNRLENLRNTTHSKNQKNRFGKGYYKKRSGFAAQIVVDGEMIYLGQHKTPGEANRAYLEAKKIYHQI